MVADRSYKIRKEDDVYDNEVILGSYPNMFSVNLHHRGKFTSLPGRRYENGMIDLVDLLDTDTFSFDVLEQIKEDLGYPRDVLCFYNYKHPTNVDLDMGIRPLRDEVDILQLLDLVHDGHRIIDMFVEIGYTNIYQNQTEKSMATVFEHIESRDNDSDSDYLHGNSEMDDSSVDMRDFNFHVDEEDESISKQLALFDDLDEMNNEEFDSGNDSSDDLGSARKRNIETHKKAFQSDVGFYLGQQFATKKDVKEFLRRYTIETRRVLKTIKDDSERVRVICVGHVPGGDQVKVENDSTLTKIPTGPPQLKNKGGRGRKSKTQEESCSFVLLVSKDKVSETWMVKTLNTRHKCIQSRCLTAMTSTFLSQELMEQIEENPSIPVKAVQEQFSKRFELSISKHQAFRARAKAQKQLHGDYTLQYGLLRDYCDELIRRNPGTTIHIEVEPPTNQDSTTRKFLRIYICFGSLKEGFKSIGRDLLGLDGAFMKGPYPGQILSAVGVDPNNGIYPLAFAIVEAENLNSWTWFLKCLGDDLDLASNSNFTFISDRQKGVLQAITTLYPYAEHRFCLRHIHENMKVAGYRGKAFKDMLWKIATQPTVVQFEKEMETLKQMNVDAHLWLSKINPKHWARSYFSGRCHSDVLLNNMCEVFNAKILEGCKGQKYDGPDGTTN